MFELLHKIALCVHVPFGFLSLVLFWIPVAMKKGSPNHRKVGRYYYRCMWMVLLTSALLSISNVFLEKYMSALYLGYLSLITAYPLWYSYEILNQDKVWSKRYFAMRKTFLAILFSTGVGMILLGVIKFGGAGMGTMMIFFGMVTLPSGREFLFSKTKAMTKETKLKMHIQGTIISGIAAYTAFFAFGGVRIIIDVLKIDHQWVMVPWILPSLLGLTYSWYMKRKYVKA